jgi:hypothetical protein
VVAALALLVLTRLRRRDPRTGWLIVVAGAFLTTAVVFSFARGIFHPYYVSVLAPFAAALIGAGVGQMLPGADASARSARVVGPLAIGAGLGTELVVLGELGGQLAWAKPLVLGVGGACVVLLAAGLSRKLRLALVAVALAALLAAPATWAAETLGHATNGTFPAGGPATAAFSGGGVGFAGPPPGGGIPGGGGAASGRGLPGLAGGATGGAPGGGGPGGGAFGGDTETLQAAIRYADAHGGGTIGVSSQGSAATAILSSDADVAGLGGFSGRESSVSAAWLAAEVRAGHLRWLVMDQSQGSGLRGDTRTGSETAMSIAAKVCRAVSLTTTSGTRVTMYDCSGRAAAILSASNDGAK